MEIFHYPPFMYSSHQKSTNISNYLYNLKEFYDFRHVDPCHRVDQNFLHHQKIVSRFLSPYTPYHKLLVIHDVGTGKSGVVCALYEEYYKLFKFEFNFIYLSNNDVTKLNFQEEMLKLSPTIKRLHEKIGYENQLKKDTKPRWRRSRLKDYNIHISKYSNLDLNNLGRRLKHKNKETVIVVDEVHNLVHKDFGENDDKLNRLTSFMNQFPKRKTMFMSGTPIRHDVCEIIPLLNLVSDEKLNLSLIHKTKEFESKLSCIPISYFRKKIDKNLIIQYQKGEKEYKSFNKKMFYPVFFSTMNEFQSSVYLENLFKHDLKQTSTMDDRLLHRHSVIVLEDEFLENLSQQQEIYQKLIIVKKYSAVFYHIMKQIIENPTQKVFVYCRYIQYAGTEIFKKILEAFGKIHKKDFIRLSYSTHCQKCCKISKHCSCPLREIDVRTKEMVKLFNESDTIKIIIGSDNQSEGLSFLNIEQIHIVSPWWNLGRAKQVVGRGIRYKSHSKLLVQKKMSLLKNLLYQRYEKQENKTNLSFLQFLQQKVQSAEIFHTINDNVYKLLENADFDLTKFEIYKTPTVTIRIFLHCALPNIDSYQKKNQELKSNQAQIHDYNEILQYKEYLLASEQENKIKNVMFSIYKHSIDYLLNYENNQIMVKDAYFQNIRDQAPTITSSYSVMNHIDIYLLHDHIYYYEPIKTLLEEIFAVEMCAKTTEDVMKYIRSILKITLVEIASILLSMISRNEQFNILHHVLYLRCYNDYLYFDFDENSEKYNYEDNHLKLPTFHIQKKSFQSHQYNIDNIKEILPSKNRIKMIGKHFQMDFLLSNGQVNKNILKKRKINQSTWNLINSLPKKIRIQMGNLHKNEKQQEATPKNFITTLYQDEKFMTLQNSLQNHVIGIELRSSKRFLLYFLEEVNFLQSSEKITILIQKILKCLSIHYKPQMEMVLKKHYSSYKQKDKLSWEMQEDIIIKTMKEYEKQYMSTTEYIFHSPWETVLNLIMTRLQTCGVDSKKAVKKIFNIDFYNQKNDKMKIEGVDIIIPHHNMYLIWIHIQIVNYNYHRLNEVNTRKWQVFFKTFLTDKRLDSTGRNIESIHFPMLFSIFKKYFTPNELQEIASEVQIFEDHLLHRKTNSERIKILKINKWRNFLKKILAQKNTIWYFDE